MATNIDNLLNKYEGDELSSTEFTTLVQAVKENQGSVKTIKVNGIETPNEEGVVNISFSTGDYTIRITQITPQSQAVSATATGINVQYKVVINNPDSTSTGELVNCKITIRQASGNEQSFNRQIAQNVTTTIQLDNYLAVGTNTIIIEATGVSTNTTGQSSFQVTMVSLSLSSNFDFSALYSSTMNVPYTISGSGIKTVEFFIDGSETPVARDTITLTSASNTKQLTISGLSLTKHTLQIKAYVTDSTFGTFYSKTLYFDFFVQGMLSSKIGLGIILGEGEFITSGETITLTNISQFSQYSYKIAAYNTTASSTDITIYENNVIKGEITVANNVIYSYVNVAKTSGIITILLYATASNYYSFTMDVTASETNLVEITDNLELSLSALGRTNSATNRDIWDYTNINGSVVSTTFTNVPFNTTCGWVESKYLLLANGGTASVGLQFLKDIDKSQGKTIELEFKTTNIYDETATIAKTLSVDNTYGLQIKANAVELISRSGVTVRTEYKAGEMVRVGIVIHSLTEDTKPALIDLYVNGIHSGCISYLSTDSFTASTSFIMGSTDADLYIKSIKVYGKALSDDDILNNYIIDRDTAAELLSVYNNNNIITSEGIIDRNVLINEVPIMILTGDVDTLVAANDKSVSVRVGVLYQEVADPTKNFSQTNVKLKLQGTSSLTYPRKNFKFTLNEAWAMHDYSFPATKFCLKADFAESSGTHNTGVARLWNDILVSANYKTEAQIAYDTYCETNNITGNDKKDVRTTVDGFPIVLFWRKTETDNPTFLGKYNFNTDKGAEQTFGFVNIPGFDDEETTPSECWEFLDNTNPIALFSTTENFDTAWSAAFERRFPDDDTVEDVTELKKLCVWLTSVNPLTAANNAERLTRLNTFYTELSNWFDINFLCAYYLYTEYFGAVDQRVKNCMLASYGWNAAHTNKIWRFINYDNDTILGIRNDGLLKYNYLIDENTIDESINSYVYAGHDSGLWAGVRQTLLTELVEVAQHLTSADYALSYSNVIDMFNNKQMSKWCERIYNMDGDYKYVQTYLEDGSPYLYSLQGSRAAHRKWWLYNRFALLNSKYSCGDFRSSYLLFLAAAAPTGTTFTVSSTIRMFLSWGFNNQVAERSTDLVEADTIYTFTNPVDTQVGNNASIYGGIYLKTCDLSNFTQYLVKVDTSNTGDESNLQELILGNNSATNVGLSSSSLNISNATKLLTLDLQGLTALTSMNLGNMTKLRELYMENSGISTLLLPESSVLSVLHYSSHIIEVDLEDMLNITTSGLVIGGYDNLISLKIKGCTNLNSQSYVESWIASSPTVSSCVVDIDNINWTSFTESNLMTLVSMSSCNLKGTIALGSLSAPNKTLLISKFGNIDSASNDLYITYPNSCTVEVISGGTIFGGNGTTTVKVSSVNPNSTLNLTETNNTSYFTITGASPIIDSVNGIISRTFTCVTTTFPINGGAYLQGSAVIGTVITKSSSLYIQGTPNVTITSIYVSPDNSTTPDQIYTPIGTHRFYCLPHCTDGSTDFNTTTDEYEIAFGININSGTVYESCTVDILNSGDDEIYVLKKNGTELARVSKYFNKNDKTIPYCDLVVTHTVNEFDEDAIGGDINAFIACGLKVTNRTLGLINFGDNLGLIVHPEYYAIQSYNELLPNYNPAVAIILYNNKASLPFGSLLDNQMINNNTTGEHGMYVTMDQAKSMITTESTRLYSFYKGITTVTDINGIVSGSYTNNILNNTTVYDFNSFDEFRFFVGYKQAFEYIGRAYNFNLFTNCTKLKTIKFHPSFTKIGGTTSWVEAGSAGFFQNCSSLNITSSCIENMTNFGQACFYGCTSLTFENLPNNLSYLHRYVFYGCTGLTNIIISSTLTNIDYCCFTDCTSLVSVTLPSTVKYIGDFAFQNCTSLVNISIPENIISIGSSAFRNCTLMSTNILFGNSFTTLGSNSFQGCTHLISVDLSRCSSLSRLENFTFFGCTSLTSILLPTTLSYMGTYLFSDCTSLTSIIIPEGVAIVGAVSYVNCTSLSSVSFPTTLTDIDINAFSNCTSLTSVDISNCPIFNKIYQSAFQNCTSLVSVILSTNIKIIDNLAFYNCTSLTTCVLPEGLLTLGDTAFGFANLLGDFTIPSTLTYFGNHCMSQNYNLERIIWKSNSTLIITKLDGLNLRSLYINKDAEINMSMGSGVQTMFTYSPISRFNEMRLINSDGSFTDSSYCYTEGVQMYETIDIPYFNTENIVTFPKTVISIYGNPSASFENCPYFKNSRTLLPRSLTTITQPYQTISINTKNIHIPTSVTTLNINWFGNIMYLHPETPPTLTISTNFNSLQKIVVGNGSSEAHDNTILAAYQAATNWSTYASYMTTQWAEDNA